MKKLPAAIAFGFAVAAAGCSAPSALPSSLAPSETHVTLSSAAYGYYGGWPFAVWTLSELWITPEVPAPGDSVIVSADILLADVPESLIQVELLVNGEVVDCRQFAVWFDISHSFYLTFIPGAPGVYDIVVRASMLENEAYVRATGEDLSRYSTAVLTVVEDD